MIERDSDDEDEGAWWYSSRDTRAIVLPRQVTLTKEAQPRVTFNLRVTFKLVDEDGGKMPDVNWPCRQPLRRCIANLQATHGNEQCDVGLKIKGRLVNPNHTPYP